jgi:esterase/lipase
MPNFINSMGPNNSGKEGDYVVILHGLIISNKYMQSFASYLKKNGFDVINLNYPSTSYNLQELTEIINQEIILKTTQYKKIHFVGFSLGGLLIRAIINKYHYPNLGRVVQLAAPNKGSEVANFLKDFKIYKKFAGPVGQQLITDQQSIKDLLGKVNYELGVIAGSFSLDLISSLIIPGPNDGKVSIESTKVEGMTDHMVVKVAHTLFPFSKTVKEQTLHFLKEGKFNHFK